MILTYTISVTDGATSPAVTQDVVITITGTNDIATVTFDDVSDTEGNSLDYSSIPPTETSVETVTINLLEDPDPIDANNPASPTTIVELDASDTQSVSSVTVENTTSAAVLTSIGNATAAQIEALFDVTTPGLVVYNRNAQLFDRLDLGDAITVNVTYTVTSGTDPVTDTIEIRVEGLNDTPYFTGNPSGLEGTVTEFADGSTVSGSEENIDNHTVSGSIDFNDVELNDTHTVGVTPIADTETPATVNYVGSLTPQTLQTGWDGTLETAGKVFWTFEVSDSVLDNLTEGESFIQKYRITISDGDVTITEDIKVTIVGTNDAPVIEAATTSSDAATEQTDETGASTAVTAGGTIVFSDVDTSSLAAGTDDADSHAISVAFVDAIHRDISSATLSTITTAIGSVAPGAITDNSASEHQFDWDFSVADTDLDFLAAGETLEIHYVITVTDDSGAANDSVEQTVTITITGTNDTPEIAVVDVEGAVTEDDAVTLSDSGSVTFDDADTTDLSDSTVALTNTATTGPTVPGGLATALASAVVLSGDIDDVHDGTVTWTFNLDNAEVQYLAFGETVTATYTITVTDDSGEANASATQEITVIITGTNDTPEIAVVDVEGAVTEDDAVTLSDSGSVTFDDADTTDLSDSTVALTNTATTGPTVPGGLATALASAVVLSGDIDDVHDGTVTWTFNLDNAEVQYLAFGETVTATYTITVTDDSGEANASATQEITVIITGTNDTPTVQAITGGTVSEAVNASAQLVSVTGSVPFTDVDASDEITTTVTGTPAIAATPGFTIPVDVASALTQVSALTFENSVISGGAPNSIGYSYAPTAVNLDFLRPGDTLTITYDVLVNDGTVDSNTESVVFTITGVNDAPVAISDTYTVAKNSSLSVPVANGLLSNDFDFDSPTLTVSKVAGQTANVGVPVELTNGSVTVQADGSLTYTPDNNAVGFDSFSYEVSDGLLTASANATISILSSNVAPIAVGDFANTVGTSSTNISVLFNDFDPDDDDLAITRVNGTPRAQSDVIELPSGATLTFVDDDASDGSPNFTYEAANGYVGLDAFSYRISDGNGGVAATQVLINVLAPANQDPVAVDDIFIGTPTSGPTEDIPFSGDVSGNDDPVDGDPLSYIVLSQPANGQVVMNANGTFIYTPNENFDQTDTFSYRVFDGRGGSDSANVTLELQAENDAPVAYDLDLSGLLEDPIPATIPGSGTLTLKLVESYSDSENPPGDELLISDLATDIDSDDTLDSTSFDFGFGTELEPLDPKATVTIDGVPTRNVLLTDLGIAYDPSNGHLTFSPNGSAVLQGLAAGQLAFVNVKFGVTDNDNGDGTPFDGGNITLKMIGVNEAPVVQTTGLDFTSSPTDEDTKVTGYIVTELPSADGNISIGELATDVDSTLGIDSFSLGTVSYEIFDGSGDPPIDGTFASAAAGGFTYNSATGEFVLDPTGLDFYQEMPAGHYVELTVGFNVSDGSLSDSGELKYRVNGVNDAPVVANDVFDVDENWTGAVDSVFATDAEDDLVPIDLLYEITGGNPGTDFGINSSTGEISVLNELDFETQATYDLTVTVTDNSSPTPASTTATVTINVNDVNDAPTANDDIIVGVNTAMQVFDLRANDIDVDGDTLTVTHIGTHEIVSYPDQVELTGVGTLDLYGPGNFLFTADPGFTGTHTFDYTLSDGSLTNTATVTLNITAGNTAPVAGVNSYTVAEDDVLVANDVDGTADSVANNNGVLWNATDADGDTLTAVLLSPPTEGVVVLLADGTFTYTPKPDYAGNDSFQYRLLDGAGGLTTGTVNLTVTDTNDPPVVTAATFPLAENSVGGTVVGTISVAGNPPAEVLEYTLSGADAALFEIIETGANAGQISVKSGVLSGELNFELKPTYEFEVIVTDDGAPNLSTTQSVTVNLLDQVETGPTATNVYLNSTAWAANFRDFVDGGTGGASRGYEVPIGVAPAEVLSWINVNQFIIQFDANVGDSLDAQDFLVDATVGVRADETTGLVPSVLRVDFDANTNLATITFKQSIDPMNFKLTVLADGVFDAQGNKLSGDQTVEVNVVPGDITGDGLVDGSDQSAIVGPPRNVGSTAYVASRDVNGSGRVDAVDRVLVSNRVGTRLNP
ncbi:tandem-95 repeat protein [Neorhodopirellula lusitana]|uniref:tandem-95 repeat protein n=1 Tax=Neorhodopirellula lusitana TaxID=445327 RepID=UPI0024B65113|nr:Ig-like domain-containing protein [Neorhodopirellula lusitana]